MSIAFPASADPEIRQAQQTMVEIWAYVQVTCIRLLLYSVWFETKAAAAAGQQSMVES
jgi:hypothetical protein